MKTAQDALITHISGGALGFATVKAYAGELIRAERDPSVVTGLLPLCHVHYRGGRTTNGHGHYQFGCLVWARTDDLQRQDVAQTALGLAEALVRWLGENIRFEAGGYTLSVDLAADIESDFLAIFNAVAIYSVTFEVREVVTG